MKKSTRSLLLTMASFLILVLGAYLLATFSFQWVGAVLFLFGIMGSLNFGFDWAFSGD